VAIKHYIQRKIRTIVNKIIFLTLLSFLYFHTHSISENNSIRRPWRSDIYIYIIIYYMSVRPSEIIVTRNHFNEEELAPSSERGRLEKGSLLFLIILHFTPLLSPPLLLPPLKFSVESLSAGHASPVTWCLRYTARMVVYHICKPTVSEISHEMTSYFALVLFSVCPMAPLLEKSRLSPGHGAPVSIISWPCLACHVVFKRYNKILLLFVGPLSFLNSYHELNLPRFEFPCNLLFCCDDMEEGNYKPT